MPEGQTNILREAESIVGGARRADYGTPLKNHSCTAKMFSTYLNQRYASSIQLDATDVCFLNILQKLSRYATTGVKHKDTLVDVAGYAANAELVWLEEQGCSNEPEPQSEPSNESPPDARPNTTTPKS